MTAETNTSAIDKDAILARLKERTGLDWHHFTYSSSHDFSATAGMARLCIGTSSTAGAKWSWEHSTTIGQGKDYPIAATVRQTHDTMDEAVAGLLAFEHLPPVNVAGAVWHQGTNLYGKPDQRVAVFGTNVATVTPGSDGFSWRRECPEAEVLTQTLRDAGCGYYTVNDLSGHADTFEAAASAAVHAPEHLRKVLKDFLKVETRALPAGAAAAFLDACCGFTDVGVAGDEALSNPTSPVVRAHLMAAIGNSVPSQFWPPQSPKNSGRILAFAEYLEAVAGQLRADVGGEG